MPDLSILIPSRNEIFLARTVEDILAHSKGDTEIIAVLDGWNTLLQSDGRLKVIQFGESVGQRAATNQAAKLSNAKYLMKVDAHCAFDDGFDIKLLADMQDHFTMVPIMRNLHAFDWVCPKGHRRYQSPSGPCKVCGEPTKMDVVWIGKSNPQSSAYCFDTEPHFQYFNKFKRRPAGKGDLTETMSLQGSCFLVTREKYWELELCSEEFGSWGSQGIEVAVKTWLSGGSVVCNHKTWYAHMFRTQGGSFGFPYEISGNQIQAAKRLARDMFFENKWEKQVRPLAWLIEKFKPVPGWHYDEGNIKRDLETLSFVMEQGAAFINSRPKLDWIPGVSNSIPSPMTNHAAPMPVDRFGKQVSVMAMGLPAFSGRGSIASKDVVSIRNEPEMLGIAASPDSANVIDNRNIATLALRNGTNEDGICESMGKKQLLIDPNLPIAVFEATSPEPTSSSGINNDLPKKPSGELRGVVHDTIIRTIIGDCKPTVGLVYYSDGHAPADILKAAQRQIQSCCNGHELVSVTLIPMTFGRNTVMNKERGYLTMFEQILEGIEQSKAEVLFLVEHDVLYHPSHFDFIPPRRDTFYYDENKWMVHARTGHALFYNHMSTSMLCAYRDLLLEHYRLRVEKVKREGFSRSFGFEPGSHKPPRGCDNYGREAYWAKFPSIDLRHDANLTPNRWRKDQFRNQKQLYAWQESDSVPGWGQTKGRMKEIINALS